MLTAVILFLLLVLFMLAGVLPVHGGMQSVIFHTPVFMLIMAGLAFSLLACCWKRKGFDARKLAFQLTHLGIVVIFAGALTGYLKAKKSEFVLPISGHHEVHQLPGPDERSSHDLGFGISVTDFTVDFYEKNDGHSSATPKRFSASFRITPPEGSTINRELKVNHPVKHAGWCFFLMSYDTEARRYVVLSARNDPGRKIVFAGIGMLMIGCTMICFRRSGDDNARI